MSALATVSMLISSMLANWKNVVALALDLQLSPALLYHSLDFYGTSSLLYLV
jgi:hypothetical protein